MANKKAVEAEALNKSNTFEYKDDTYTIPPAREWPLEAVRAQEKMQLLTFIEEILGEDQATTLMKKAKTLGDLDDFVGAMYASVDVDKGKS